MATSSNSTTTSTPDLFDFEGALKQWTDASRKATEDTLDLYLKTVDELADRRGEGREGHQGRGAGHDRRGARRRQPRGRRHLRQRRARPDQGLAPPLVGALPSPLLALHAPTARPGGGPSSFRAVRHTRSTTSALRRLPAHCPRMPEPVTSSLGCSALRP